MSGVDSLITSIQNSQTSEQALIANLDNLIKAPGFNVNNTGVQSLMDSIKSLSDARVAMFRSLSTQADTLQAGVSNSRVDLVSQMTLLNVVEDQLAQARTAIDTLHSQNDTKKRMVEVNTYYGQRYEAHSKLMKIIIMVCVPLLLLFILKKKGLLPPMISSYVIGITIAIGAIFIMREIWDISNRNNINFDEYDWKYEDPANYSPTIWEYNKKNFFNFDNPIKNLVGNLGLCVSSDCCAEGLYFDQKKQKCTKLKTENFTTRTSGLQGSVIAPIDEEEDKEDGIKPYSF